MFDLVKELRDKAFAHPPPDMELRIEDRAANVIEAYEDALQWIDTYDPSLAQSAREKFGLSEWTRTIEEPKMSTNLNAGLEE